MPDMKTPGVYIVDHSTFPNPVAAVSTAVPAFVGYTEKAEFGGQSCAGKPLFIASLAEFHNAFGQAPHAVFELKEAQGRNARILAGPARKGYSLQQVAGRFGLYWGMNFFFQNGGSSCCVVSVGQYGDGKDEQKNRAAVDPEALKAGIAALELEAMPTMLVVPEAVGLPDEAACIDVQQAMLRHCGLKMRNRVAILDVYDGHRELKDGPVDRFGEHLGPDGLDFAAAYYPHLHTSIVSSQDLDYRNVLGSGALLQLLREDLELQEEPATNPPTQLALEDALLNLIDQYARLQASMRSQATTAPTTATPAATPDRPKTAPSQRTPKQINAVLLVLSRAFAALLDEMARQLNLLPPSSAIAGSLCGLDAEVGVWNASAIPSVKMALRPAVELTDEDQASLTVTPQGKSVNAIRPVAGQGVWVSWGRTLDGSSLAVRDLHVRRTLILLEESCRLAVRSFAFEPNEPNTWATLRSSLESVLMGIWNLGGLAGRSVEDAFAVLVGLGQTMTPQDILEGVLRVTVLVALTHPAEFTEITFEQKMSPQGPG